MNLEEFSNFFIYLNNKFLQKKYSYYPLALVATQIKQYFFNKSQNKDNTRLIKVLKTRLEFLINIAELSKTIVFLTKNLESTLAELTKFLENDNLKLTPQSVSNFFEDLENQAITNSTYGQTSIGLPLPLWLTTQAKQAMKFAQYLIDKDKPEDTFNILMETYEIILKNRTDECLNEDELKIACAVAKSAINIEKLGYAIIIYSHYSKADLNRLKIDPSILVEIPYLIGKYLAYIGELLNAHCYYLEAVDLSKKYNCLNEELKCLISLSESYYLQDNYPESRKYFDDFTTKWRYFETFSLLEKVDKMGFAHAIIDIKQNNLEQSKFIIKKTLELLSEFRDEAGSNPELMHSSIEFLRLTKSQSIDYRDFIFDIYSQCNNQGRLNFRRDFLAELAEIGQEISCYYTKKHEYQKAEIILEKVCSLKNLEFNDSISSFASLVNFYIKFNDIQKAQAILDKISAHISEENKENFQASIDRLSLKIQLRSSQKNASPMWAHPKKPTTPNPILNEEPELTHLKKTG